MNWLEIYKIREYKIINANLNCNAYYAVTKREGKDLLHEGCEFSVLCDIGK